MANPKILEIIQSFSVEEKVEFPLFLNSPFFLRGVNPVEMVRLFKCLLDATTNPQKGGPEKPVIHAIVFPEKVYSGARVERAYMKLGQLAEQFLLARHYQRAEHEQQRALDLIGILREKKLATRYEKNLQKLKNEVQENALDSTEDYLFQYQITREEHEWRSTFNKAKGDLAIPETVRNLDLFFLTERTELVNRILLQQKVTTLEKVNTPLYLFKFPSFSEQYEAQSPILLIRRKIQELFLERKTSKQDFETLIELIIAHEARFSKESIKELYTYLRNVCVLMINEGNVEMIRVLHDIQQDNLKRGYFYIDGQITPYTFLNITFAALSAKETAWTKQFVESHRHRIFSENESEDFYNINMAYCLFAEKKYEEVLERISFDSTYSHYLLAARRLELKAYYELRSELLFYKMDAFRKFLERTAPKIITKERRDFHINFVNLLSQLSQSRPKDAQRSVRLIKRINEKKHVAERTWLLEKAQELG